MKESNYNYSREYFEHGMDGWHQQSFKSITFEFNEAFKEKKIKTILDFGSGDGFYGSFLGNYSENVDGMDISDEIKQSKHLINYRNFIQADLAGDIKGEEKYNVIFSSEVIEHVLDYNKFLTNARTVSEKDGYLFLTTTTFAFSIFVYLISFPQKFKFKELRKYFAGLFGNVKMRTEFLQNIWGWTKGHYHGFSKRQMKQGLNDVGWEVISIKYLKVQPFIYNEVFLNPFKNVKLRYLVILIARVLYVITGGINWVVKNTGIYSSNILVVAKNNA